jgi:PAS domain S-box-containing protein
MEERYFNGRKNIITIVWSIAVLLCLYFASRYSYLLFHSLAEIFSIVVACGIFMIAWNSRGFLDNNYVLLLGIAYLFIGGIDLFHTLAYPGMRVFKGAGANLPTQLWIAARYMESLSFLVAPFFLGRKLKTDSVFAGYILTTALLLVSVFYGNIFPDCFVEGVGLTPFKKISEYIICMILMAAVFLLFKNREDFDSGVLQLLTASIIATVASELVFTLYKDAYGVFNLSGHFLKIISFYFIYKAIIETGLVKPYNLLFRNLKHEEQQYRNLFDHAPSMYVVTSRQEGVPIVEDCNALFLGNLGYSRAEVLGRPIGDFYTPESAQKSIEGYKLALKNRFTIEERRLVTRNGRIIDTLLHARPETDAAGQIIGTLTVYMDISKRKRVEAELERSASLLRATLESTADGILVVDRDGKIIDFNQKFVALWGIPESVLASRDDQQALAFGSEQLKDPEAFFTKVRGLYSQPDSVNFDILEFKDGRILERYSQALWIGEKSVGRVWSFCDVTERKQAEEQIKTSLREKEVLLAEIYHRTKNNMQVICGLLSLQSMYIADKQVLDIFRETENRIRSMALVHEKLYQAKDLSRIDLKDYIEDLANGLLNSYQVGTDRISLKFDTVTVPLSIDIAVPCGLVVNELMSNSLKHGFPDGREGEIRISVGVSDDNEIKIRYSDNGIGFPKDFDLKKPESLGVRLITNLVENQLAGKLELKADNGAEFQIGFKDLPYKPRI